MKSNYLQQQKRDISKCILGNKSVAVLESEKIAEHLVDNGVRKITKGFLFLHVLIGTWGWYLGVCIMLFQAGLFRFESEYAANNLFVIWIAIPSLAIVAMCISSFIETRKIWKYSTR